MVLCDAYLEALTYERYLAAGTLDRDLLLSTTYTMAYILGMARSYTHIIRAVRTFGSLPSPPSAPRNDDQHFEHEISFFIVPSV